MCTSKERRQTAHPDHTPETAAGHTPPTESEIAVSDATTETIERPENATSAPSAPSAAPSTPKELQNRLNAAIEELTKKKADLDKADQELADAHAEKQDAVSKANAEKQARLKAVREEEDKKVDKARSEGEEVVSLARDAANAARDIYSTRRDEVTDAKTGLVPAATLAGIGLDTPGNKRK